MATDFSKYLRDNWPLGWAINKAKSAHNTIGFESGGFTFVIEGASFDPGEPPTRDSDGQAACIAWANDGGVYISNPVAGGPSRGRASACSWTNTRTKSSPSWTARRGLTQRTAQREGPVWTGRQAIGE